jgi:hypothetical protein
MQADWRLTPDEGNGELEATGSLQSTEEIARRAMFDVARYSGGLCTPTRIGFRTSYRQR